MVRINKSQIRKGFFAVSFLVIVLSYKTYAQNEVAIGSTTTKSNAILYLNGNGSQGLILPVVTNKTSVSGPDKGMIVFDNSDNKVWYRSDNAWVEVGGSSTGGDNGTLTLQLSGGNTLQLRDGATILSSVDIATGTGTRTSGDFMVWNGTTWQYTKLTDMNGTNGQVTGIRGKAIPDLSTITTTQVLVYDGTAWKFQTLPGGTDSQTLSFASPNLSISNGNTVDLSALDKDAQTLTVAGNNLSISGGNTVVLPTGTGTVTNVSGNLPISVLNPGTTPVISMTQANTTTDGFLSKNDFALFNNKVSLGGDLGGTAASPSVSKIQGVAVSSTAPTSNQVLQYIGTSWVPATLTAGTVNSVGLSLPSIFTVSNSPVTNSGTLTGTLASQNANTVFAAPNGSNGVPAFRGLVAADITGGVIPTTLGGTGLSFSAGSIGNGQLLIGAGGSFAKANLSAGNGINITNGSGTISVATSGNFGSQNLTTSGTLNAGAATVSGLTIGTATWPGNAPGVLTNNGSGTLTWAPSGGSGTVTSVSVSTANGIIGSVTDPTGAPAISLALGAITPTSVAATGTLSGSNLSGTNTGDQTTITGNAGTATALATGRTIGITGDVTYTSPIFNGTANVTGTSTVTRINGTSLAGLPTGVLKNTTGTGVPGIATGADLPAMTATAGGAVPTPPNDATKFLAGNGTWATPAVGGTGTVTSVSVTTANGISGVVTDPTGAPAISLALGAITPTSVAATGTLAGSNLSGTNTGDQTITLTGNVTGTGNGSFPTTIANGVVTNAMLNAVPTATFKGRATAANGAPEDLTVAQAKTLLNLTGTNSGDQTITLTGDVTGSGTGSFVTTLATVPVAKGGTGLTAAPANGQLMIGNGTGYALSTLTAGTGVNITNAAGAITINTTGLSPALNSGQIYVGSAGNLATGISMSGDATLTNTGLLTIADGAISGGTGGKITDGSITSDDILNATITTAKIAPNGTTRSILANGSAGNVLWVAPSGNNQVIGSNGTGDLVFRDATTAVSNSGTGIRTVAGGATDGVIATELSVREALDAAKGWGLTGNDISSTPTSFIGTTGSNDLIFKTNSAETMRITPSGKVGIGTSTPLSDLQISATTHLFDFTTGSALSYNLYENAGSLSHTTAGKASALALEPGKAGLYVNSAASADAPFGSSLANRMVLTETGLSVNKDAADPSAVLHVVSATVAGGGTPRGFMMPSLITSDRDAIPSPLTGLMIFNETTNSPNYYNGTSWQSLVSGWGLTGNTLTGTEFIGSVNAQDLVFKTNNIQRMKINTSGNISFATNPWPASAALEADLEVYKQGVNSKIRIIGLDTEAQVFQLYGQTLAGGVVNGWALWRNNSNESFAISNNTGLNGSTSSTQRLNISSTTGNVAIGTASILAQSKLDVGGNISVGSAYAGVIAAPANGAIIQGNVGIGTNAPGTNLHVVGSIRMVDGNQAAGRVLTSDASGLASWQPAGAGSGWTLLGNAGTSATNNFIGTTDAIPFNIRVNNKKAGRIDVDGAGENVSLGTLALEVISTGQRNVAIGTKALQSLTASPDNIAIGKSALLSLGSTNTIGSNTAIGSQALTQNTTGYRNTALGYLAGSDSSSPDVAGTGIIAGNNNTFIGSVAGPSTTANVNTLTNATAIGANAKVTANNTMVFGNGVVGWGFGVQPGAAAIRVGTGVTNGNGATLTLTGTWTSTSDSTKKFNVMPLKYGLAEVMKLKPVNYQWKNTQQKDFGFLAQDVKAVLPEIVYGEEGQMSVSYGQITSVLTKAIQEQQQEIEELKAQLKEKNNKVNTLESSVTSMREELEDIKLVLGIQSNLKTNGKK